MWLSRPRWNMQTITDNSKGSDLINVWTIWGHPPVAILRQWVRNETGISRPDETECWIRFDSQPVGGVDNTIVPQTTARFTNPGISRMAKRMARTIVDADYKHRRHFGFEIMVRGVSEHVKNVSKLFLPESARVFCHVAQCEGFLLPRLRKLIWYSDTPIISVSAGSNPVHA